MSVIHEPESGLSFSVDKHDSHPAACTVKSDSPTAPEHDHEHRIRTRTPEYLEFFPVS